MMNLPQVTANTQFTSAEAAILIQIASLADPNANVLLGWDDTDGEYRYFVLGSGLSYDHSTHTLSASGSGVSFGTVGQVPYTNATGDDFDYTADLVFDGTNLSLATGSIDVAGNLQAGGDLLLDTASVINFDGGDVTITHSANLLTLAGGDLAISNLTASEIVITDASKNLVSAPVATYPSLTELTYLKGVTSAIQTQLGAKQATITFGTGVETALGVNVGSAGAFVVFDGALGTPSSGTVTNLTGTASININGTVGATTPTTGVFTTLVAGSTTSLLLGTAGSAVGNIGFRNATSGTITLEPVTGALGTVTLSLPAATDQLVGRATTDTLTNKRITKRTGTTTSSATPTINTDNVDEYYITAQAEAITSFTTNLSGTPTLGQLLFISVIGTAARAITWGASFANGPVALPTTTVTTTQLSVLLKWDGSIWRCYASGSTV